MRFISCVERYGYNSMNLLTLLIALGAMVISLTAISNSDTIMYAYLSAGVILLASIGFALYEKDKQAKNQSSLQHNLDKTLSAIERYNCKKNLEGAQ